MALHHVVLEEFAKSLKECGLVDITFRSKDGGFQTFNMKQLAESITTLLTYDIEKAAGDLGDQSVSLPPFLPPAR